MDIDIGVGVGVGTTRATGTDAGATGTDAGTDAGIGVCFLTRVTLRFGSVTVTGLGSIVCDALEDISDDCAIMRVNLI
jgi:hypothetical protein